MPASVRLTLRLVLQVASGALLGGLLARVIVSALNEFEASLTTTEKDNISTDEAQSANYQRTAGRLGG